MDDYTWERDTDSTPSDLSVDDILAEFHFDLPAEPKTAAPEASAPIFQDAPIAAPVLREAEDSAPVFDGVPLSASAPAAEEDPAAWADSLVQTEDRVWEEPVPEKDVEDYLNPEEDTYEDDEPLDEEAFTYTRRQRASAPAKRGLFSFLSGRKAAREPDYDEPDKSEQGEAAPPETPEEDIAPAGRTANERPYRQESHSGSLGRMEQEARDAIAQLRSELGGPARRERGIGHSVDLDTLLGIDPEDERPERPAPEGEAGLAQAVESGYDEGLDYDYDYDEAESAAPDADPTQYGEEDEVYRPSARREEEIDSRFNLSGRKQREQMTYGGSAVDLSADEDYVPTTPTGYNPSQWTPDYDDPLAERSEEIEEPRKKHRFLFGRSRQEAVRRERVRDEEAAAAAQAPYEEETAKPVVTYTAFDDEDAQPAAYAPQEDYDDEDADFPLEGDEDDDPGRGSRYRDSELYVPPTFREYLLSLLASFWLRLRGTARGSTAETMADNEEDLGPELSPAEASKYYGSLLRNMKLRLRIASVLLAILCYVSLEAPVPGMLKTLPVMAIFCFGLQAAILLLALDVVTTGILNVFRLRIGADTLAVFACLFTGLDALNVALNDAAALHMPLCAISSASMVGLLLAATLSAKGLRKAIRVPAIGKHFYAVTAEEKLAPGEITLLKSLRSAKGFVHRAEEAGPDETLYNKISLPLLSLAFLLTIVVMIAKKSYAEFLYILSALLVLTVPFGAMLSFALPFSLGSNRIFRFGAAIAGWSGLCDIGASKNLTVTDRDLFPENAITIDSVRIFADEDAQKVISYAGTIMSASGCCSAACFVELMKETNSPMRTVDGFEFLPGGGMKGVIDGHVVLCGSTDLMRLMNVRIPFRLTDKTTVLLAIDGILYGIFSLKYEGLPTIRRALVDLMRTSRPPVFAVRDFNINPEMLHNTFDLATDGYDFPPFADRFKLSEPAADARNERITAILCNEGLPPLTGVADVGRSMYLATRVNVWINLLAAVLGVLMVFVRLVGAGTCPLSTLFFYMLFWTIPVLAVSAFVAAKR